MIRTAILTAALIAGVTASAQAAVSFTIDNVTVAARTVDPGLRMASAFTGPVSTGPLNVGDSATVNVFKLWTVESSVDLLPDRIQRSLTATLDFLEYGGFSASPTGATFGDGNTRTVPSSSFPFFRLQSRGFASFVAGGSETVAFGNGGLLQVVLLDSRGFNLGNYANGLGYPTSPGEASGTTIQAKITLLAESIDPINPVPEPASVALLGAGLLGLGTLVRRRRAD